MITDRISNQRSGPSRLSRAWEVLRREGAGPLARKAFKKLASHLAQVGRVRLFVRPLFHGPSARSQEDDGLELGTVGADRIDDLLACGNPAHSRKALEDRFARGDRCFVALDESGGVAHVRWVTTGRAWIPELHRYLVLSPIDAYMYDGFTRSDMRRRGIDGKIRRHIFRTMGEAGYCRVYSYVRGDNAPGLLAAESWQRGCGSLWYLRPRVGPNLVLGARRLPSDLALRRPEGRRGGGEDRVGQADGQGGGAVPQSERDHRAGAWRAWFESWLEKPCSCRSTGYSDLPEEYFTAMGGWVADTLGLAPDSGRVLDVGCDSAMVTRHVAPRCGRLVGVDYVPELLAGRPEDRLDTGSGRPTAFLAGDGRRLPFADDGFSHVYCTGVLHTLPGHVDALRMIRELVRVCRPGGTVLLAALPDAGKRWKAVAESWRRSGLKERLRLLGSPLLPRRLKKLLRRRLLPSDDRLTALEFDVRDLARELEGSGLRCDVRHFPEGFWSRDFRTTRSNLVIRLPAEEDLG